jgi:hypothetical protein
VHRGEIDAAQANTQRLDILREPAYVAFLHFFHMDNANAQMHVSDTRYSPITFRLAEALQDLIETTGELDEVLTHRGRYAEDPGR